METKRYIKVIIPLKLAWEPCYSIPEQIAQGQSVRVGSRVRVNFVNREYVVPVSEVDVTPEMDSSKIKPIKAVEDGMPPFSLEEIRLWRMLANYYMCSVGEVYKAAAPAYKIEAEKARVAAADRLIQRQMRKNQQLREAALRKIASLESRQVRVEQELETLKGSRRVRRMEDLTLAIEKIRKELEVSRMKLAELEGASGERTVGEETAGVNAAGMNAAGKCAIGEEKAGKVVELSRAQQGAYEEIRKGFEIGKPVLLNGVTGSGKTEIYIKLALETLQKGGNVLYLVPEIALSRQLEDRLREFFPDKLVVFHSGETTATRQSSSDKVRKDSYLALATRSGIFLPHHDLSLIIIDEEHDTSYKQDSPAPRYNGRDSALMLATIHSTPEKRCNVLLGSATPSLEELYNCSCKKHLEVKLEEKYYGSQDSDIELIDTKAEWKKHGMEGSFSRKLISLVNQTLERGKQVMILRSRRSWAPMIQCTECGQIQKCPKCNVSLSLHKAANGTETEVCHYCGFQRPYTGKCTKCSSEVKPTGAGTQKIEEQARALFPEAVIARLDSDTAQSRAYSKKTIREFSEGKTDILIGTQMLAKGFDFSNLELVAVISADSMLGMQDFRADEKAAQILEQFRGRSSRRSKGLFVIQTAQPDHPVYQRLLNNQNKELSQDLLQERKLFGYPPYSRIVEIEFRDSSQSRAGRMSESLAGELQKWAFSVKGINIVGPWSPAVDKTDNQYIRKIRISLAKNRELSANKETILKIIDSFEKKWNYNGHIGIDVDPS
ncbi:MAG: primosomal protein N' [Candidatus Cryptobacteroides sp.]|nr:primosomal protein N' [Candidatus Cryptobacteroides sp.]